ncbi:hypothetical protein [Halalkalibacter krulwichiae]|uniref:DUF4367 domain-containing protein n=1 Tax=Halalkalibacter krulwichiae TaxID=199441 RepID=A0A1X9MD16_9BACI|nr:hypothetical protein [Halalkalibacter krulwichiae]ARK30534.1 hypothetical protein BkAM31D_12225 [Halalkalibacter krulwichiae]
MIKQGLSIFLLAIMVIAISSVTMIQAQSFTDKEIDEFVKVNKYKTVKEALDIFEKRINQKVSLPAKLPFKPTHYFGKITENGDLQLHYMNVEEKHEDFIFYILYPDTKVDEHISSEDKVLTLDDGSKAYYRLNSVYPRSLAFKKNGLGYLIGGNPNQNGKYNVEGLLEIANSIQ